MNATVVNGVLSAIVANGGADNAYRDWRDRGAYFPVTLIVDDNDDSGGGAPNVLWLVFDRARTEFTLIDVTDDDADADADRPSLRGRGIAPLKVTTHGVLRLMRVLADRIVDLLTTPSCAKLWELGVLLMDGGGGGGGRSTELTVVGNMLDALIYLRGMKETNMAIVDALKTMTDHYDTIDGALLVEASTHSVRHLAKKVVGPQLCL